MRREEEKEWKIRKGRYKEWEGEMSGMGREWRKQL